MWEFFPLKEAIGRPTTKRNPLICAWHRLCWLLNSVPKFPTVPGLVCLAWLALAGAGFGVLLDYQNASGVLGRTPAVWPPEADAVLDRERSTLIMFAHPQCPCTKASVEELNRLLALGQARVAAQVWFFKPPGFPAEWTQSSLWKSAKTIPGVTVHEDLGGRQAQLFGAATSGYVVLYAPHGQLLFNGGITGSRGHAGDNEGESAIASLLAGQAAHVRQTPVYGCSLTGECKTAQNSIPR
jgi:hypothetical protein